jgi:hypothetical protein
VLHPAALAALWDYGPRSERAAAALRAWSTPDGPGIVLLDSARQGVLEHLLEGLRPWPLDSEIAASLAADVTEMVSRLSAQPNVQVLSTGPLVVPAFILAATLGISLAEAMCVFVAAATGNELVWLERPNQDILVRIVQRFPQLRYSTLT